MSINLITKTYEVVVVGAEAVNKSYPAFWSDFTSLGGKVSLEESL